MSLFQKVPLTMVHQEKIFIETTERKEILRKNFLGIIHWDTVINTNKIKDDLVIWTPMNKIDKIWIIQDGCQKQELRVSN